MDPRQLSAAELLGVDAPLAAPHAPPAPWSRAASVPLRPARRHAALDLPTWVRSHRFLRACPLPQDEPAVALLILWESGLLPHSGFGRPWSLRTPHAAAADSAFAWLQSRGAKLPLAPGLPPASFSQWSAHIDLSPVGDPFLTSGKTQLLEHLRTHRLSAAPPGPPAAPSPPPAQSSPPRTPRRHGSHPRSDPEVSPVPTPFPRALLGSRLRAPPP